ncbi:DUF4260 domain-containing protein [Gramella sp. GC03-9]|uniref:DUF4260 domain-containing protein n=1 Tax=Christiangramia oceanisediminis TaxID=2920386 RepID=A0A9X2IA14_9FLAO|nr:DUF4260 domain-containing protein [Gramella oceanisediminis]MCP9198783.1 DUF4260 domain-containing protein [Gramella oceanisediminis]
MTTSLKIEELAMLVLGIWGFSLLNYSWWWFAGLFFLPDIGMLGYLVNNKIGAISYNIFHHKAIAIGIGLIGIFSQSPELQLAGIILFSHSSFDRMLGYGLKYEKGFKFTHLGEIGK